MEAIVENQSNLFLESYLLSMMSNRRSLRSKSQRPASSEEDEAEAIITSLKNINGKTPKAKRSRASKKQNKLTIENLREARDNLSQLANNFLQHPEPSPLPLSNRSITANQLTNQPLNPIQSTDSLRSTEPIHPNVSVQPNASCQSNDSLRSTEPINPNASGQSNASVQSTGLALYTPSISSTEFHKFKNEITSEMFKLGKKKEFPGKIFYIKTVSSAKPKKYTSYLNFSWSKELVIPDEKISLYCYFCPYGNKGGVITVSDTYNFMTNLKNKDSKITELKEWIEANKECFPSPSNKTIITEDTMKIVRYFISTNAALSNFDNKHFRELLYKYPKVPCSKTFKSVILDDVNYAVKHELNNLLSNAVSVLVISDIWTNKQMLDFMGIAVNIIDKYFVKQTMVIGLEIMPGRHNAENIKKAIEDLVNSYDFNKQIVSGIIQFICFSHF